MQPSSDVQTPPGRGAASAETDRLGRRSSPLDTCAGVAKQDRTKFRWNGLALHLGASKKPVLVLVAEVAYPHLFRIRYPNGWTSAPANITRARDAAYCHARFLVALRPSEASYRPETRSGGISEQEAA